MGFVTSKVKLNFTKIAQLNMAVSEALEKTAESLKTEVVIAQVMPFDTGNLQNNSTFVDDSNIKKGQANLVSSTPYARKIYYHPEFNFQKTNNAHAQGEWYKDWVSGKKKDFASKAFIEFYKESAGLE